jgi:UDP-GlcNAc:undecaprenyl-phosphate GlcNAc-1-phosphate transferase
VREYLLCLLVACAVTYVTVPVVRAVAVRWGAMAEIRDRDVHDTPTPRLGGVAMLLGVLAAMLVASKLRMMSALFDDGGREPIGLLSAMAVIVALGIIDDRWGMDAPVKLAGQVLAGGLLALQGVAIIWLPIGGTLVLDPLTSVLLTVIVVVVSVNAINFIDGLDGLAAGMAAIAGIAFFVYAYLMTVDLGFERSTLAALCSVLVAGVCLGFLPYNFSPARLFMGDTGSMLLGLLLAASSITLSGQIDPGALEGTTFLPALIPILLPFAVLSVPLLDIVLAIVRRTRKRRSPFAPDKEHLHHRLVEVGHSTPRAVLLMYAWSALIATTALGLAFVPFTWALSFLGVGILALASWVLHPRWQRASAARRRKRQVRAAAKVG